MKKLVALKFLKPFLHVNACFGGGDITGGLGGEEEVETSNE